MRANVRFAALACVSMFLLAPRIVAGAGLELVQLVTEEKDKEPHILSRKGGFFHVFPITWRGDYVYAATHYEGLINIFKRDAAGKLTYVDHLSFDEPKNLAGMSITDFVWAGGRLYFYGGAGHCTADYDSRGLHWLEVDTTTGKLTPKGRIDIPLAHGLAVDPAQKNLYLLLGQKKMIVRYRLAADGTPEKVAEMPAPAVGGFRMTGDGKAFYSYCPSGQPAPDKATPPPTMLYAEIKADGSVVYSGTCTLKEMTEGLTYTPRADGKPGFFWEKDSKTTNHFGWGWGASQAFSISPDGRHCYVSWDSNTRDKEHHRLGLYARNPQSNELTFVEMLNVTGAENILRADQLLPAVFEPDGLTGYAGGGGWLVRDPKTGRLTLGGQVQDAGEASPLYLDSENGFLYGGCWARQGLTVMKTGKKTAGPANGADK